MALHRHIVALTDTFNWQTSVTGPFPSGRIKNNTNIDKWSYMSLCLSVGENVSHYGFYDLFGSNIIFNLLYIDYITTYRFNCRGNQYVVVGQESAL